MSPFCFTNLRFLEIINQALPKYVSVHIHTYTHLFVFIQLILIHRFYIFEFAYILKCLCDPHISTHSTSMVFVDMCRVVKKSRLLVEVNRGDTAFLFQLCLSTSVLFVNLFSAMFFAFLWFHSKCSLFQVLCSGFKCKAVRCLLKRIHVLTELHLGMRHSAVGREFSVSKSCL